MPAMERIRDTVVPAKSVGSLPGSGYRVAVPVFFHVSSVANRESIRAFGLDWTRMGAAPGIAGSTRPEAEGIFLCADEFTADFFVRMNNTGGAVDVWEVHDVDPDALRDNGAGFEYLPEKIGRTRVTLVRTDAVARW